MSKRWHILEIEKMVSVNIQLEEYDRRWGDGQERRSCASLQTIFEIFNQSPWENERQNKPIILVCLESDPISQMGEIRLRK